jgi:hypothetical protein
MFFLFWIFTGSVFMFYCFIFKAKPFFQETIDKINDRNDPWETKYTDDFLSFFMIEFYECGANNTQLMVSLYLLLRDNDKDFIFPTPGFPYAFNPHGLCILIGLIPRVITFFIYCFASWTGNVVGATGFSAIVFSILGVINAGVGITLMVLLFNPTYGPILASHPLYFVWIF